MTRPFDLGKSRLKTVKLLKWSSFRLLKHRATLKTTERTEYNLFCCFLFCFVLEHHSVITTGWWLNVWNWDINNKCEHILVDKGFETRCVVQKQSGILPCGGFCTTSVLTDKNPEKIAWADKIIIFIHWFFLYYLLSLNAHALSFHYNSNSYTSRLYLN